MYYICSKENLLAVSNKQHLSGAHWIDLPDGTILVKARFTNEGAVSRFEDHPTVQSLPHPTTSKTVGADVAKRLGHLGVKESHTTYDVAELASKQHPLLKYRG